MNIIRTIIIILYFIPTAEAFDESLTKIGLIELELVCVYLGPEMRIPPPGPCAVFCHMFLDGPGN